MTLLHFVIGLPVFFVILYAGARVVSAAVFKSKQDHDQQTRKVPR